jgi:hypothetical protein
MSRKSIQIVETLERSKELWGEHCLGKRKNQRECLRYANQGGHVLPQDTIHIRRYGEDVIHHPLNIKPTCSLACNGTVELDYRTWPILADAWAAVIRLVLDGDITTDEAKQELALIDAVREEL